MTLGAALRSLPATQDDFEAWCLAPEGPDLGHFEFLYGCVVAEPPASWPHGLRNGVREYWLLDPRRREITVLVRGSRERFERACTAAGDSLAHSTLLPEFATRPTAVFPARS